MIISADILVNKDAEAQAEKKCICSLTLSSAGCEHMYVTHDLRCDKVGFHQIEMTRAVNTS